MYLVHHIYKMWYNEINSWSWWNKIEKSQWSNKNFHEHTNIDKLKLSLFLLTFFYCCFYWCKSLLHLSKLWTRWFFYRFCFESSLILNNLHFWKACWCILKFHWDYLKRVCERFKSFVGQSFVRVFHRNCSLW